MEPEPNSSSSFIGSFLCIIWTHIAKAMLTVGVVVAFLVWWFQGYMFIWFLFSSVVKTVLTIIVFIAFLIWWFQGYLLYIPNVPERNRQIAYNHQSFRSPASWRLPFEDFYIPTKDKIRIHCWFLKQNEVSNAPTLIYFHGNAGNIGFRLQSASQLYNSCDINILLVEYRGYGNSEGEPSEHGLQLDAEAALDYLLARGDVNKKTIFAFGRSLGGAVAMYLGHAHQDKVCGVIVENTFTSIDEIVLDIGENIGVKYVRHFKWFFYVFITSHWNSKKRAQETQLPMLYLSGLEDTLIPPAHMQQLFDNSKMSNHNVLKTYENGGHNDTYMKGGEKYTADVREFINYVCYGNDL